MSAQADNEHSDVIEGLRAHALFLPDGQHRDDLNACIAEYDSVTSYLNEIEMIANNPTFEAERLARACLAFYTVHTDHIFDHGRENDQRTEKLATLVAELKSLAQPETPAQPLAPAWPPEAEEPDEIRDLRRDVAEFSRSHHDEETGDRFTVGNMRAIVYYVDELKKRAMVTAWPPEVRAVVEKIKSLPRYDDTGDYGSITAERWFDADEVLAALSSALLAASPAGVADNG